MIEKVVDKISVNFVSNHVTGTVTPRYIKWQNRVYRIAKVGLHYTLYRGNTLFHMFSVCDSDHYFLLSFNTKTLHWQLEEIADSQVN